MLRVMLFDDDALVLRSLETILTHHNYQVVGKYTDGIDGLAAYQEAKPDIVLMDIRMKQQNGIQTAKQILSQDAQAKILLLTTFQDEDYIRQALAIGCSGYILKQSVHHIIPSIEAVAAGSLVFDQEVVSKMQIRQNHAKQILSDSEFKLLEAVAQGYSNKEIADRLFLSEGTVRNYVSKLLEKLELRDRTQLAIYYYKN